jgi:hypothetical protein
MDVTKQQAMLNIASIDYETSKGSYVMKGQSNTGENLTAVPNPKRRPITVIETKRIRHS